MRFRVPQYRSVYRDHPITAELAVTVLLLFAFRHWFGAVAQFGRQALSSATGVWAFAVSGGVVYLVAFVTFVGVYVAVRDVPVSTSLPSVADLRTVGWALALPIALVLVTDVVVGMVFESGYGTLGVVVADTAASLDRFLATGVVWDLLTAVGLTLLYQVAVQGSFRSVLTNDAAVVLTTAVASAVTMVGTARLSVVPNVTGLTYVAAFVAALCLVLYAMNNVERDWLFYCSYLPLLGVVALPLVRWVLTMNAPSDVLYPVVQVTVLGFAAGAYERTDSLLVPVLTYVAFLVSGSAVAFFFDVVPA